MIAEVWYKGVPVVAVKANGSRQYIRHGVNEMLSEIDHVDGLAKNLQAVLDDADLRNRLVAAGISSYETSFSKEVVIDNLLKTYEEIIHRGVIKNQ